MGCGGSKSTATAQSPNGPKHTGATPAARTEVLASSQPKSVPVGSLSAQS